MRMAFIALAVGLSAGLLMIYPKLTKPPAASFISADDEMRRLLQDQAEQRPQQPPVSSDQQGGEPPETMPVDTKEPVSESPKTPSAGNGSSTKTEVDKSDAMLGKLNLNTATAEQLDELPGVGPSRAQAILELRQQLGGKFRSPDQLLEVKGIGEKTLEKIKPHVTVEP